MIATSAPQLLMVAGVIIASSSPSAVSWLYFANRLIELPLGIVGVAMGTVLIPELTRALRSDDRAAIAYAESRGLELAVGLALPATLGLIVLSEPIVRLLFEHGAFTAADAAATAQALMWLALALAGPCAGQGAVAGVLRARGYADAVAGDAKGVAFAIAAGGPARPSGSAQAALPPRIALGAWSTAVTLIRRGAETFGFSIDAEARRRLPRMVAAALAMGALLWLAARLLLPPARTRMASRRPLVLLILIAGGIAIYGLFLRLFGITGWREAVNAIRQK